MRYNLLGRSGLRVSEVALGAMSFGEDWGWGVSKEESRRIFEAYAEAGGNFVDTAVNYTDGTSERYVGEFVDRDRDRFVIASKYTCRDGTSDPHDPNAGGNHRKNMLRSVDRSLRQLGVDHLDVLYLHIWDGTTPVEEIMRGFDDLVSSGKVGYVAISDTPAWVVAKANTLAELRGWAPLVALQFKYSLTVRDAERELIPMARSEGLAMTVWGVFDRGVLTGKYRTEGATARGDEVTERRATLGRAVVELAGESGASPAQVALSWVRQRLGQGPPIIPILGVRSADQLKDAMDGLTLELTAEQLARLEDLSAVDLGFPGSFLVEERIESVLFGKTKPLLDDHRV